MENFQIKDLPVTSSNIINCFNDAVVFYKKNYLHNSDSIIDINKAAEKLFGYSRVEFLALPIEDIFHKMTLKRLHGAKDLSRIAEGFCIDKAGNIIPVEFYSNCIDEDEDIHMLVIKNITEKRQSEEQLSRYLEEVHENKDLMEKNAYELVLLNLKLEESEERLRELNSDKDKFFSIISHDLKSPFNAFLGLTEVLADDLEHMEINDVKVHLQDLNQNAQNVYSLLENLLNWSRVQIGRIDFAPEFISPFELESRIKSLFETSFKQKNISYTSVSKTDRNIFADRNMAETILRNLISNAIKFTHDGGQITVSIVDENDKVKFSVKDSGVGIEEENISRLFRIDTARSTLGTKNEKGTGLGLILSKEFVERCGGTISVESRPGNGTLFSFTMPVKIKKD